MHRSLLAVALLMLAPLATAQVYKWTDASGTVHYSQEAPPQGTKYNQVKTTGTVDPIAAPAAAATAESSNQTAASPASAGATAENDSSFCKSLRSNLAALQGSGPVVMAMNGKTTALDDDQRKQQTSATQAQYDQYCQNK